MRNRIASVVFLVALVLAVAGLAVRADVARSHVPKEFHDSSWDLESSIVAASARAVVQSHDSYWRVAPAAASLVLAPRAYHDSGWLETREAASLRYAPRHVPDAYWSVAAAGG